ncbi:multidrug resistance efflux transporter family protein [Vulgatibacter incomptus]|uniref:Membrane protein, putative n=1 Tax=Vulgatibacter incomptus TaxID=1391653 RepID=A0A0K1PJ63_9BACT|nr:multidrug resistance efflux transporter family protein [Vulgatibacter incomptus]AKU93144.1 membrane protein, putative [Vulgatibacter incomptus]
MNKTAFRAVLLALASALFFTLTYVLNRRAAVAGGHWAWTASLRYLITLPILAGLVGLRGGARPVLSAMRASPGPWLAWSGIGFVLFYVCLSYAADSGPSWLVAAGFQLTVVAGMVLAPLLYDDERGRIPPLAFGIGLVTVGGVVLMQLGRIGSGLQSDGWIALGCVLVSAFAYPFGNRRMLLHLEREGRSLSALQRVFGMTLASMPLWLVVAVWGFVRSGAPSIEQVWLSGGVAVSAGVIATVLFFEATGRVRNDPTALGAVEAMQGSELLFATLMGVALLDEPWPAGWTLVGGVVVLLGLAGLAAVSARPRSLPRP